MKFILPLILATALQLTGWVNRVIAFVLFGLVALWPVVFFVWPNLWRRFGAMDLRTAAVVLGEEIAAWSAQRQTAERQGIPQTGGLRSMDGIDRATPVLESIATYEARWHRRVGQLAAQLLRHRLISDEDADLLQRGAQDSRAMDQIAAILRRGSRRQP